MHHVEIVAGIVGGGIIGINVFWKTDLVFSNQVKDRYSSK